MDLFEVVLNLLMTILSVFDMKMRKIPVCLIIFGMGIALLRLALIFPWNGPPSEQQRIFTVALLGALPGLVVTALSFITDKIGRGDGAVMIMIGLFEDCTFVTLASCIGCIFLAVCSGILLAFHRVGKNTPMPFVPFLTGSILILMILQRRF